MDIDIDFKTDFDPLDYFTNAVRASMVDKGALRKHPAGAYLQSIPKDGVTGLAAIPYKQAEKIGYFKIDFLHLTLLDIFESKAEIRALIKKEPDWSLLEDQETVEKLFQIHRHFDVVYKIKPKSIIDLADVMALIRPSKRYLINTYINSIEKENVRKILYTRPDDGKMWFKKSHSVAYSHYIVLQLHLIKGNIL